MKEKNRYVVHVREQSTSWTVIEVEAEDQGEAEQLALENARHDWSDSICDETETCILTENGHPVEWSESAFLLDMKNPYRRKAAT